MLAIIGALMVGALAVMYAGDTVPSRIDVRIENLVDESSSAAAWNAVLVLDWFGEPVGRTLMVLAVAAVCLIAGRRALAVTAVIGIGLTTVLTTALKYVVGREIHGDYLSFPSGHTAAVTAAAMILALLVADLAAAGPVLGTALLLGFAIAGGGAMAWAQIDLNAHYPTDTLGGFGSALFAIPATALLIDSFRERRAARPAS